MFTQTNNEFPCSILTL